MADDILPPAFHPVIQPDDLIANEGDIYCLNDDAKQCCDTADNAILLQMSAYLQQSNATLANIYRSIGGGLSLTLDSAAKAIEDSLTHIDDNLLSLIVQSDRNVTVTVPESSSITNYSTVVNQTENDNRQTYWELSNVNQDETIGTIGGQSGDNGTAGGNQYGVWGNVPYVPADHASDDNRPNGGSDGDRSDGPRGRICVDTGGHIGITINESVSGNGGGGGAGGNGGNSGGDSVAASAVSQGGNAVANAASRPYPVDLSQLLPFLFSHDDDSWRNAALDWLGGGFIALKSIRSFKEYAELSLPDNIEGKEKVSDPTESESKVY